MVRLAFWEHVERKCFLFYIKFYTLEHLFQVSISHLGDVMHPCFLRCTDSDRPQLAPNSPGYLLAVQLLATFFKDEFDVRL